MTENVWRDCGNLYAMLTFVQSRLSARKLGLFAVACCRRISRHFRDPRSIAALDVNELYADGLVTVEELESAAYLALEANDELFCGRPDDLIGRTAAEVPCGLRSSFDPHRIGWAICTTVGEVAIEAALDSRDGDADTEDASESAQSKEIFAQMALLDEVVGNPFRPTSIDPIWLSWNDATVRRIAQGIYEERAFDRLPILHDALLDAGCDNEDILAHCQ